MIRAPWASVRKRIWSRVRVVAPMRDNVAMSDFPQPARAAWGEFPDVLIHADEGATKRHPDYAAAKAGDVRAAKQLVADILDAPAVARLRRMIGGRDVILAPVHAVEASGVNRIPAVMAELLGERIGAPVAREIVQSNRAGHTGASGYQRLAFPPLFEGDVSRGQEYFLVDDFVGQGGTLANLKGFIEQAGGRVAGATTLTGKPYSAKLALDSRTLTRLREKHGTELEKWWERRYGYGFDALTESEARYLERADDADLIRNRIAQARSGADAS